jgi:hypothetical protein
MIFDITESFFNELKTGDYETGFQIHDDQKKLESFLHQANKLDFIGGHYAAMPYVYNEDIKGFSIIREPIERMISCFIYFKGDDADYIGNHTNEYPDNFIESIRYQGFRFEKDSMGFNARPNMQCANLVNTILWNDKKAYIKNADFSFSEILKIIKKQKMTLSTFENRNYLIKDLTFHLNAFRNTSISIRAHSEIRPSNNLHNVSIDLLSNEIIEEIKASNALDYQLYKYIKDHETRTGRCLTPDDIYI